MLIMTPLLFVVASGETETTEQKTEKPNSLILPDSPWYIFVRIGEFIGDMLTVDKQEQILRDLEIAQKRLWESSDIIDNTDLLDEDDKESLKETVQSYRDRIERSKERTETIKDSDTFEKLSNKIEGLLSIQEITLTEVLDKVPMGFEDFFDGLSNYLGDYKGFLKNFKSGIMDKLLDVTENIIEQERISDEIDRKLQDKREEGK